MTAPLLRVAVVGATGALGGELIGQLAERRFPVQELRPIATEHSLGESVEWLGYELPVLTGAEALADLDVVFVCTPRAAALDWIGRADDEGVACLDFSGALAASLEVPLLGATHAPEPAVLAAPLLTVPAAPALALARVLAPLRAAGGIVRLVATLCDGAAGAGRAGVDALQAETIALFNQEELPETGLERALAFDCLPACGPLDEAGASEAEVRVARELERLLDDALPAAIATLRVPIFAGMGIQVSIETARPLAPEEAVAQLGKTPGVVLWPASGPSTRDAIGDEAVQVGRVRRDASTAQGLSLWLALDPVRLVASVALDAVASRFRRSR